MKRRAAYLFILGYLITELLLDSAFAQFGIVDQEHHALTYPTSQASFVTADNRGAAQTFTVGRSGTLSTIEVGLIRWADTESVLIADIRRVVNNVPDFSERGVLATRTMSSRILPIVGYPGIYISQFTLAIDFQSDNLRVEVGDKLALYLHSSDVYDPETINQFPYWWIDAPAGIGPERYDGYVGGDLYAPMSPTLVVPPLPPGIYPYNDDAHFRTYVIAPEPSSATQLLLACLCGFSCRRRRC